MPLMLTLLTTTKTPPAFSTFNFKNHNHQQDHWWETEAANLTPLWSHFLKVITRIVLRRRTASLMFIMLSSLKLALSTLFSLGCSAKFVVCVFLQCARGMSGRGGERWRWRGKEDGLEARGEASAWAPLTLDPVEVNAQTALTRVNRVCVSPAVDHCGDEKRKARRSSRGLNAGVSCHDSERERKRVTGWYGGTLGLIKRGCDKSVKWDTFLI